MHILAPSYWVPLASLLSSSISQVQFSGWTRAQKPRWQISSFGLELGRLWMASLVFWPLCVRAHMLIHFIWVQLWYNPMVCSPPDSSVHGILQARNTGVGCYILLQRIFLTQGSNLNLLCLLHQKVGFFFITKATWEVPQDEKKKLNFGIKVEAYLLPNSIIKWATLSSSQGWDFNFIISFNRYSPNF